MSAVDPSYEEVSSLVQAPESLLSELLSLGQSSDGGDLPAGVDDVLAEGTVAVCCRFAERSDATNVESAVSLLEIALSNEFRKYLSFVVDFVDSRVGLYDTSRQFKDNGITIRCRAHTVSLFLQNFPGTIASDSLLGRF